MLRNLLCERNSSACDHHASDDLLYGCGAGSHQHDVCSRHGAMRLALEHPDCMADPGPLEFPCENRGKYAARHRGHEADIRPPLQHQAACVREDRRETTHLALPAAGQYRDQRAACQFEFPARGIAGQPPRQGIGQRGAVGVPAGAGELSRRNARGGDERVGDDVQPDDGLIVEHARLPGREFLKKIGKKAPEGAFSLRLGFLYWLLRVVFQFLLLKLTVASQLLADF